MYDTSIFFWFYLNTTHALCVHFMDGGLKLEICNKRMWCRKCIDILCDSCSQRKGKLPEDGCRVHDISGPHTELGNTCKLYYTFVLKFRITSVVTKMKYTLILTPWLKKPVGSMPHSQGLFNNPYPEPNQPNSPHWHLSLQGPFQYCPPIYA